MTKCYKTLNDAKCNGCMNVTWDLLWRGSRSAKHCIFPCKVVAGGVEGQLVCAAGAVAAVALTCDWFLHCVLHRTVVRVCVALGAGGTCGCRSQWNGCITVFIFCCHAR